MFGHLAATNLVSLQRKPTPLPPDIETLVNVAAKYYKALWQTVAKTDPSLVTFALS